VGAVRARRFFLVTQIVLTVLVACRAAPSTGEAPRATATTASSGGANASAAPLRSALLVVAAGDIACDAEPRTSGDRCRYGDTARLIDGRGIDGVLALGDEQYDVGAYRAFVDHFGPAWGDAARQIFPVPGNHEYAQDPTSSASGYFRYFGDAVRGPDDAGYYSYDLGSCPDAPCWHMIALNSMLCFAHGGCGQPADRTSARPGEAMWRWLRGDLAEHPNDEYPCTLAYWHHPLFSVSTESGPSAAVRPLWRLLQRGGADVVLNGHSHNYQRWAPQTATGVRDPEGIRAFVVGTGGASRYPVSDADPATLEKVNDDAFGVLRLALKPDGYEWQFVTVPGDPAFTDASTGTVACH
jgi:hypothetical protein